MSNFNNRVYGLVGVKSEMANWNADFTGNPRTLGDGTIFGSDKALKYSMKHLWANNGLDVLYRKSIVKGKKEGELGLRDLEEKFKDLTGVENMKKEKASDVLEKLLGFVDVENFGATFAVTGHNHSITGVVQIGQGLNVDEESDIHVMDITSPFRNSNENSKDSTQTSIGKKIVSDKAHYVYPFSVNPGNLEGFKQVIDGYEGYSQEAFDRFQEAARFGATALNTNSKSGAFNSFAVFITLKEGSQTFLPNLNSFVDLDEEEGTLDVALLDGLIKDIEDQVDSFEVFVDVSRLSVVGTETAKVKNIITGREV